MDTLSRLVAMHLLDRSCVIVGKKFEILRSPTNMSVDPNHGRLFGWMPKLLNNDKILAVLHFLRQLQGESATTNSIANYLTRLDLAWLAMAPSK